VRFRTNAATTNRSASASSCALAAAPSMLLLFLFPPTALIDSKTFSPNARSPVRTEDIGNKLTDHIGYTSNWADALEKCVTDGTETTICEFGRDESFYGYGSLTKVRDFA
jgi:hypothetical protein